jgi:hypothetical protein
MNAHRFHEWPLVVFTTLAVMGAGLLTSPLVAAIVGPSAAAASPVLPLATALLAAGLLVSIAHLGRPLRAPLAITRVVSRTGVSPVGGVPPVSAQALTRVRPSRLSAEVVLATLTVATGMAAVRFPFLSPWLVLTPAVCAVAFLVSLGLVYALPGQLAWRGTVVWTPLVMGLGFGTLGLAAAWDGAFGAVGPVAGMLLAVDVSLFLWRRFGDLGAAGARGRVRAQVLLGARFLLVDIVPGCLVLAGLPRGAAGALALGILFDRLAFYLLAAQHTTEAEIARVEDVIARGRP